MNVHETMKLSPSDSIMFQYILVVVYLDTDVILNLIMELFTIFECRNVTEPFHAPAASTRT